MRNIRCAYLYTGGTLISVKRCSLFSSETSCTGPPQTHSQSQKHSVSETHALLCDRDEDSARGAGAVAGPVELWTRVMERELR